VLKLEDGPECSAVRAILVGADARQASEARSATEGEGIRLDAVASPAEMTLLDLGRVDVIATWDSDGTLDIVQDILLAGGHCFPMLAIGEGATVRRVVQAMKGRVVDYIDWPAEAGMLAGAIQAAHDAKLLMAPRLERIAHARAALSKLSPRERQVLDRMAEGLTNKLIARSLRISPRTVEIHRANMLEKLQSRSSADAIRVAFEAAMSVQFRLDAPRKRTEVGVERGSEAVAS
jgi:two-component system response regulator FixJ